MIHIKHQHFSNNIHSSESVNLLKCLVQSGALVHVKSVTIHSRSVVRVLQQLILDALLTYFDYSSYTIRCFLMFCVCLRVLVGGKRLYSQTTQLFLTNSQMSWSGNKIYVDTRRRLCVCFCFNLTLTGMILSKRYFPSVKSLWVRGYYILARIWCSPGEI